MKIIRESGCNCVYANQNETLPKGKVDAFDVQAKGYVSTNIEQGDVAIITGGTKLVVKMYDLSNGWMGV